jgi:hypothetical protein
MYDTLYSHRQFGNTGPQPGDIIVRVKAGGVVEHKGFVCDFDRVLHNLPERGDHSSTITEFAVGHEVRVIKSVPLTWEVAQRVDQILRNPKRYNLFFWNCDHTVTRAAFGEPVSEQVEAVGTGALIGFVFLMVGAVIFGRKA